MDKIIAYILVVHRRDNAFLTTPEIRVRRTEDEVKDIVKELQLDPNKDDWVVVSREF